MKGLSSKGTNSYRIADLDKLIRIPLEIAKKEQKRSKEAREQRIKSNTMLGSSFRRCNIIPRSFRVVIPLYIRVEIILAIAIFNKASGFFGILSLFTGKPIGAVEWVLNVFSLCVLPLYVATYSKFANKSAFQIVIFAYTYIVDTFVSLGLTIFFCIHWFTSASHKVQSSIGEENSFATIGADETTTINTVTSAVATAVYTTTAAVTATTTTVVNAFVEGVMNTEGESGEMMNGGDVNGDAMGSMMNNMVETIKRMADADTQNINKSATLGQETGLSIFITVMLLLIRFYFMFVVISYARHVLRQHNSRRYKSEPGSSKWRARFWRFVALSFFL